MIYCFDPELDEDANREPLSYDNDQERAKHILKRRIPACCILFCIGGQKCFDFKYWFVLLFAIIYAQLHNYELGLPDSCNGSGDRSHSSEYISTS